MKSLVRPSFWNAYAALDLRARAAARKAYQLFAQNPDHPSLRFKKLGGYEHIWSVRINEQYRAVGERDGDTIVWVWIGSHNEFDSRFGWNNGVAAETYAASVAGEFAFKRGRLFQNTAAKNAALLLVSEVRPMLAAYREPRASCPCRRS